MDKNEYKISLKYMPDSYTRVDLSIEKNDRQVDFKKLPERERKIYESMVASVFQALSDINEKLNPKKDKEK